MHGAFARTATASTARYQRTAESRHGWLDSNVASTSTLPQRLPESPEWTSHRNDLTVIVHSGVALVIV